MRSLSTIQSTRRGFFYQDSYTVFCYLKNLANKNVKRFYADYPQDKQRSLDIFFLDSSERENIFEVKSGELFPGKTNELKDAMICLFELWKEKKNASLNLIIRKGYRKKIITPWGHVQKLFDSPTLITQEAKQSSEYIKDLLSLESSDVAHSFCRSLILDSEHDDIEEYDADNHPPLIDSCIRLIDDISPKFKAQECNFEYPNEILIFRLLNELIKFAGSKTDLHLRFIEIIASFFSRRRLFAEHYDGKNAKEIKEESIKKEVKEIFEKEFSIVWPKDSVGSENQEGGVVK